MECKSNTNSLDVYSLRFQNCQVVYPHTIIRPSAKYKLTDKKHLSQFIHDLNINRCLIKLFIGDNPKRAFVKYCLQHGSAYACEYCFSRATTLNLCDEDILEKKKELERQIDSIQRQIDNIQEGKEEEEQEEDEHVQTLITIKNELLKSIKELSKKKTKLVWPSSTIDGEPRTKEKILEIVNKLEQNPNLPPSECKGVTGRSPLLALPHFDFVRDSPTEYLHSVCIGVVKKTIILTFDVGIKRPRLTQRKLTPISYFNAEMLKIKVVGEFARRARALEFSVFKGQEYRNIVLFFFPIVVNCIEETELERKLWLLLAYMMRACVLPKKEFQSIQIEEIHACSVQFYKLFEKLFGAFNCSYNVHIVGGHIVEMRVHGPLTMSSAFGFEHFYGELRHSFVPGTQSPLKQAFQKIMLKRALSHHSCAPPIEYTNHETALECNNLVYTYRHNEYNFFKIVDVVNDDKTLKCLKFDIVPHFFPETPNLRWEKVGVFEQEGIGNDLVNVDVDLVQGKLIKIDNLLLTCPNNILEEK